MKSILLLLIFCSQICFADSQSVRLQVTVSCPDGETRRSEPVVIKLSKVKKCPRNVKHALVTSNGTDIPSQLDDMDGDNRADELVFLTDITPGEKQTFDVTLCSLGKQVEYPSKVYAHMSINSKDDTEISSFEALGTSNVFNNLYHHGACFENELVGYRIYSDSRQNVDIYGKRKHRLELATTKFNSTAKHLAADYGHDVLWNGESVACGTLRDWKDGTVAKITDVKRRGQCIIAYGPLRTVVEVTDFGWHDSLNCRTYYTLYAGHREVRVDAVFDEPLPAEQLFCTGVQKVGSAPIGMMNDGILASWGSDWPDYSKKDVYPIQTVGLAVMLPSQYINKVVEDSLNYLAVLQAPGESGFHYWLAFCADMEEDSPYHSAETWFADLPRLRQKLLNPLIVKIK